MLDVLKNLKFLKIALIIVAVILGLNIFLFIASYWKLMLLGLIGYGVYKIFKS